MDVDWNDAANDRLRALWDEGLTTAAIADRMGCSKNAVVGKAHRLGLPSRPSPIRRDGAPQRKVLLVASRRAAAREAIALPEPEPDAAPPIPVVVMPETRANDGGQIIPLNAFANNRLAVRGPTLDATLAASRALAAAPAAPPARAGEGCRYIAGDPRARPRPEPLFCDAATVGGSSYCGEHLALCYDRRASVGMPHPAWGRGL